MRKHIDFGVVLIGNIEASSEYSVKPLTRDFGSTIIQKHPQVWCCVDRGEYLDVLPNFGQRRGTGVFTRKAEPSDDGVQGSTDAGCFVVVEIPRADFRQAQGTYCNAYKVASKFDRPRPEHQIDRVIL